MADNKYLPVPHSTQSYWRAQPHWLDEFRSTEKLPETCDIAIIGTGMTGVSTAYHLQNLDPNHERSILLLEARETCSGATGRNGGHSKVKPTTTMTLVEEYGQQSAANFVEFVHKTIYALKETIEKEGLDCEHELRRSYDVFLENEQAKNVSQVFTSMVQGGFDGFKDVDSIAQHVAYITSAKDAKFALSTPALSLWPYKFVTELLERVLERGANLQTNTPVKSIRELDNGQSILSTPCGSIRAKTVVFATNAYTAGLLPQFEGTIVPYKGQCSHIAAPIDRWLPRLANTYNIHHRADDVEYLNPRPDGGVIVGGGNVMYRKNKALWYNTVDDSTLIEPAKNFFDGYMQKTFSGWEHSDAATDYLWTGIMGRTPDGLPHVGVVPGTSSNYVCGGFNGGGMPLIFLCAQGIAQMICEGKSFEDTMIPGEFKTTTDRRSSQRPAKS